MAISPVVEAVQTLLQENRLSLPTQLTTLSTVATGDYDALYTTIATLLPHLPTPLHHTLYEVASRAFTPFDDFTPLRETCANHLTSSKPSKPKDTANEEHTTNAERLVPASPSSDASNHHASAPDTDCDEEFESDHPFTTVPHDVVPYLGDVSAQASSRWKLEPVPAFTRAQSCHHSILYHAGYFPYERKFGVPYFATEAPPNSHRLYDDVPTNADPVACTREGAPDRATLVDAHRGSRTRWSPRELAILRDLVCFRAGGDSSDRNFVDREECRAIARGWNVDVWDSLATQAGMRLGGRPGHALMCKFRNGGHDDWTDGEDGLLRDATAVNACLKDADGGWDVVGAAVKRPGMACLRRWQEIHAKKKSAWTPADDLQLRNAVGAVGKQWRSVALIMGDRTGPQCMHRYMKQLSGKRAGRWSMDEMRKLREAVSNVGNDWTEIANRVGSRNDVQCREKWLCGLDPDVKHAPWEVEEDDLLRKAVDKVKAKDWGKIAKMIPERNETQCRRRMMILDNIKTQLEKEQRKNEEQAMKRVRQKVGRWSRKETENLRAAVRELGNDWEQIAKRVASRGTRRCQEKWEALSHTPLQKVDPVALQSRNKPGRWSKEETKRLSEAVEQVGQTWDEVAKRVRSRDDKQCCEKWVALQQGQQDKPWNGLDDQILQAAVEDYTAKAGNPDWEVICAKLKRDQSSCKRRYEVLKRSVRRKRPSHISSEERAAKRRKQGRWSLEETRLLKAGLELHEQNFQAIASMVKSRNESQCRDKWHSMLTAAAIDATWTPAEDDALVKAIEQNGLSWETIGESMPGRSIPHCRKRWKLLREQGRSGRQPRWKPAETAQLRLAYNELGEDWVRIAQRVGDRKDWQCRLRIGIGWRPCDDEKLRQAVLETGGRWCEVKNRMPGFSEVMCKRRWKVLHGGRKDACTNAEPEEGVKKEDILRVADVVKSVAKDILKEEESIKAEDVTRIEDYHADTDAMVKELQNEDIAVCKERDDEVRSTASEGDVAMEKADG